jgi:hypothetical protein
LFIFFTAEVSHFFSQIVIKKNIFPKNYDHKVVVKKKKVEKNQTKIFETKYARVVPKRVEFEAWSVNGFLM